MTCESSFSVSVSLRPCLQPLGFEHALLKQFCLAGLYRKVSLGKRYFDFAWVAVLRDEVAGIAGEHDVRYILGCTLGHGDRFVDVNKMILGQMPTHFAGCFRFADDLAEVSPLGITQQVLNISGQPIFNAAFGLLCMAFKRVGQGLNQLFLHAASPVLTLFFGMRLRTSASGSCL